MDTKRGAARVGVLVLAALLAACGGPESTPAGEPGDQEAAGAETGPPEAGDRAPAEGAGARPMAPRGGDMPMGGAMGEMHSRMMGGGDPGNVPEATAMEASAQGCPDVSQELVDAGREVFAGAGNCYTCHGGEATGTSLAPDLTDGEWLNVDGSYGAIAELVQTGVARPRQFPAPMPAMGGGSLSGDQVCGVAAYVYSLSR